MIRISLAVLAAAIAWIAFAALCGFVLRGAWPAYVSAEPAFAFTLPMLLTRLAIGAGATLLGGLTAALVARRDRRAAWGFAILLLLLFVPQHVVLFDRFPIWYHALFLLSLAPLALLGGRLASGFLRNA